MQRAAPKQSLHPHLGFLSGGVSTGRAGLPELKQEQPGVPTPWGVLAGSQDKEAGAQEAGEWRGIWSAPRSASVLSYLLLS